MHPGNLLCGDGVQASDGEGSIRASRFTAYVLNIRDPNILLYTKPNTLLGVVLGIQWTTRERRSLLPRSLLRYENRHRVLHLIYGMILASLILSNAVVKPLTVSTSS